MPVDQAVQMTTDLVMGFRPTHGEPWAPKHEKRPFEEVPDFPYDYHVNSYGEDPEIKASIENTKKAEELFEKELKIPKVKKQADLKINDLGVDPDILRTQENIKEAEDEVGHKLENVSFEKVNKLPQVPKVIDHGPDPDMQANKKSLSIAEALLKHNLTIVNARKRAEKLE